MIFLSLNTSKLFQYDKLYCYLHTIVIRETEHQSEKAKIVNEFHARRREAANNKLRAHAQLFGGKHLPAPKGTPTSPKNKPEQVKKKKHFETYITMNY